MLFFLFSANMSMMPRHSANDEGPRPKSMTRPKAWTEQVEEAYRFQLAGYRDESEYLSFQRKDVSKQIHSR